jgi:phospholipid/cholesterol/gamma-HCH transport system substrate-binding protein
MRLRKRGGSRLEHMTGGGATKAAAVSYDLTAPRAFPPPQKTAGTQIVIPEPVTLVVLDTQRIIVDPSAGEPLENVQWSDTIPKLLQEKIIQSFEASNYVAAVAKPMEGLVADYQLLIDLRSFQITGAAGAPTAHVEFAAKLLGEAGRIVGSRTFDAVVPATDVTAAGAAAALNEAFGKAVIGLVTWAAGAI